MKIRNLLFLQFAVFVYSLSSIFSKYASKEVFLSIKYLLFIGLSFLCLGLYAIFWQQILKKTSLSIAYANKGTMVIWGILLGYLVFSEKVSVNNIIGCIIVLLGILVLAKGDTDNE